MELITVAEMAVTVMTVVVTIMSVAVAIMIVVGAAVAVMTVVRSSNNGVFYTVAKNSRLGEKKTRVYVLSFAATQQDFPPALRLYKLSLYSLQNNKRN